MWHNEKEGFTRTPSRTITAGLRLAQVVVEYHDQEDELQVENDVFVVTEVETGAPDGHVYVTKEDIHVLEEMCLKPVREHSGFATFAGGSFSVVPLTVQGTDGKWYKIILEEVTTK